MRKNERVIVATVGLFILLLVSYKFSLFHETNQLNVLTQQSVPLFFRILTYTFMLIGIIPTALLILYSSMLCTTTYPSGTVLTWCFGSPFAVSDSAGFFAYIIASLITAVIVGWTYSRLLEHSHVAGKH